MYTVFDIALGVALGLIIFLLGLAAVFLAASFAVVLKEARTELKNIFELFREGHFNLGAIVVFMLLTVVASVISVVMSLVLLNP